MMAWGDPHQPSPPVSPPKPLERPVSAFCLQDPPRRLQAPGDLLEGALDDWCTDPAKSDAKFGPIGTWNVSACTDMPGLIYRMWCGYNFNADINGWDVGRVVHSWGSNPRPAAVSQDPVSALEASWDRPT